MKYLVTHVWYLFLEKAVSMGQELKVQPFKDRSWLGYKTRSRKYVFLTNVLFFATQCVADVL